MKFPIYAPFNSDSESEDFGVRKFTAGTTHLCTALPASWSGKDVILRAEGGTVHYGFSSNPDAEIDRSVAATADGASDLVGGILPDGIEFETPRTIPHVRHSGSVYFVRESTAADTVVYIELTGSPGQ